MFGAWSYLSYLWDLGFGGAKRCGCFQRGQAGEGTTLMGKRAPLCNNAALKLYCKSYWVL